MNVIDVENEGESAIYLSRNHAWIMNASSGGAQLKLPLSRKCSHDIQKSRSQNRVKSWKTFCWHMSGSVCIKRERGWNWKIIGNKRHSQHSSSLYLVHVCRQPVTFIVRPSQQNSVFNDRFQIYCSSNRFHSQHTVWSIFPFRLRFFNASSSFPSLNIYCS